MRKACFFALLPLALLFAASLARGAGLPDDVKAELAKGTVLPDADYRLARSWECAGPDHHNTGHRVDDPDAAGHAAWEVRPDADPTDQAAVFGPYLELDPGSYLALFRVKLPDAADDDLVARLDAVVAFGQKTLASRDLFTGDLTPGQYRVVPLLFAYPGGKLECRVHWTGAAALRIDRIALYAVAGPVHLHAGMVPQPQSTGAPRDLPYRGPPPACPDLFPRAEKPAAQLLVADLRGVSADQRAALLALQGLVNRREPSVYGIIDPLDEQWLRWMERRGYVAAVERLADPLALLDRYRGRVKGVIVPDPRLPASKNVATMLAALRDALPATPRLARQFGLPVLEDLRGRWQTNAEAYRWAFDQLWPDLNHQTIACLWPDDASGLRDYAVQQKLFTFWLGGRIDGAQPGGSSQADLETLEAIFARMPTNIPVLGYPYAGVDVGIGEHDGVQSFARYAKYLVGSSGCTNLSVLTGYAIPDLKQNRPPAPKLEDGKVYVTWLMSDGDNLPVLSRGNFPQLWDDPDRGKVPIAWSLSPAAAQVMPPVVDYYYQTATPNDVFVGAVSGIGYTYPEDYAGRFEPDARGRLLDEFLALTHAGMERSDLRELWLMGIDPGPMIRRYAEKIPTLDGLFPDYGRRMTRPADVFYPTARGVPVFHAVTGWAEQDDHAQKVARALEQVRSLAPAEGNGFLHLFIWNWGAELSVLPEVMEKLGPRYVAVRPDHLAALARQWLAARKLLIRAPGRLLVLEGRPATCRLTLANPTGAPLAVAAGVIEGLDPATVTPDRGELPAFASADLVVRGVPHGDHVTLRFTGPFGEHQERLPFTTVAERELTGPLPAEPLEYVERFAGAALAHRSGGAEVDADALDGRAWCATAGATTPGYIVYGPYRPTEAGRYVALFRVKRTGGGAGILATLDAHVGGAAAGLTARELQAADLPAGAYRCVPLLFDHPGGALETRVFWPGKAGIAVDGILLFRVGSPR